VSDRKDGAVRVGAEQAITREVEASERNVRPRGCFDVAMQDLAPRFREEPSRLKKRTMEQLCSNLLHNWSSGGCQSCDSTRGIGT